MKRFALILLVVGIAGLLWFLALRSNDSGTRTVAPEASEGRDATASESEVVAAPTSAPSDASDVEQVFELAIPQAAIDDAVAEASR